MKNIINNIIGAILGIIIALLGFLLREKYGSMEIMVYIVTLIFSFVLSIIIHELGHLIFGKISGYDFLFFRFLKYIIYRKDGKLCVGKEKYPGILGQCLLVPRPGNRRYFWYNAGGSINNFVIGVIALTLSFLFKNGIILAILYAVICTNFFFSLINIIPIKDPVSNDGMNIILIKKNPNTLNLLRDIIIKQKQIMEEKTYKNLMFDFSLDDELEKTNFAVNYYIFMYYTCMTNGDLNNAFLILNKLYHLRDNYSQMLCNGITIEYMSFVGLFKGEVDVAFQEYSFIPSKLKNQIETIELEQFLRISYMFNRYIKEDRSKAQKKLDKYVQKYNQSALPYDIEMRMLYKNMMREYVKIDFNKDFEIKDITYVTIFNDFLLFLEHAKKIDYRPTEYIENGKVLFLKDNQICIKFEYDIVGFEKIIYGGIEYTPEEFMLKENIFVGSILNIK